MSDAELLNALNDYTSISMILSDTETAKNSIRMYNEIISKLKEKNPNYNSALKFNNTFQILPNDQREALQNQLYESFGGEQTYKTAIGQCLNIEIGLLRILIEDDVFEKTSQDIDWENMTPRERIKKKKEIRSAYNYDEELEEITHCMEEIGNGLEDNSYLNNPLLSEIKQESLQRLEQLINSDSFNNNVKESHRDEIKELVLKGDIGVIDYLTKQIALYSSNEHAEGSFDDRIKARAEDLIKSCKQLKKDKITNNLTSNGCDPDWAARFVEMYPVFLL